MKISDFFRKLASKGLSDFRKSLIEIECGASRFKFLNALSNGWFKFFNWFRVHAETIERMVWWAWKMRKSYDWDQCYLYEVILLKLTRMEYSFDHYSNCVWTGESKTLRRLRVAKECARRLVEDDFGRYRDAHDTKWGELKMDFERIEGEHSRALFSRPKANTDEEKAQERAESTAAWHKEDALRTKTLRVMCKIITKESFGWWD